MRGFSSTLSFVGHAALLTWGLYSVAPEPFEDQLVEALPVEFITISEVTDLTKGVKTAKKVIDSEEITETPQTVSEIISENPGPAEAPAEKPEPEPVKQVAKETVKASPPEPKSEPEPTPIPLPEPEPVEVAQPKPVPLPEPDPVKIAKPEPEPTPEPEKPVEVASLEDASALEELIKKELEKQDPVTATPPAPAPAVPAPRLNPRPKKQRLAAADPTKLLNKKEPRTNSGGKPKKKASLGTKTGTRGAKLTQTELDGLRDAIQRCWNLPPGYSAGRNFHAKVRTTLSKDGRVTGRVKVVSVTGYDGGPPLLIKKAVSDAIQGCAPYKLPSAKYAEWKDLEVTFYP